MPSLIPETSSLVAMEAIACGTPVVAYPAGALPYIIDPGVTGFIVSDQLEIADAIHAVDSIDRDRDRGTPRGATPPTPPGIRVRTTAVRSG
jgi:glycosyltransferase involved in cell wall biosynthesis